MKHHAFANSHGDKTRWQPDKGDHKEAVGILPCGGGGGGGGRHMHTWHSC